LGCDRYLAQGKSDPLAQLVLTVEGISEEMALELKKWLQFVKK
jgi:hypothetical protein